MAISEEFKGRIYKLFQFKTKRKALMIENKTDSGKCNYIDGSSDVWVGIHNNRIEQLSCLQNYLPSLDFKTILADKKLIKELGQIILKISGKFSV